MSTISVNLCVDAGVAPGVRLIEYAPIDSIDPNTIERIISAGYNQQRSVGFLSGSWLQLPVLINSGQWTEEETTAADGNYYKTQITATLPADTPAVRGNLNQMKQHRYLVRMTGRDGIPVLIGTLEQPLTFSSAWTSGTQPGDLRGYKITFSGVGLHPSPGYIPIF